MKIKSVSFKPARIEMVPLIDSFFLILVYFIIAFLSMSKHQGIPLNLPQATTAVEEQVEHFGISVTKEGELFWNQEAISFGELFEELQTVRNDFPLDKINIYIYGDENAQHGVVIKVLDVVRKSGITKIFMETQKEGVL